MNEIREILRDALGKRGWSLFAAAKKMKINRHFLGRLVKGGRPPKLLKGGRSGAAPDDRYRRIAKALNLDETEFLDAVAQAQNPQRTPSQSRRPEAVEEGLRPPADLSVRYSELLAVVDVGRPLSGEAELLNLANECLDALLSPQESRYWQERLRSPGRSSRLSPNPEHDHIGEVNAFDLHAPLGADERLCLRIADEITDPSAKYDRQGMSTVTSCEARSLIASYFFELGLCASRRPSGR